MSLADICEPFFLFVCRINAAARKGVALDQRHIRSQLEQELAELHGRAAEGGGGSNLRRQVEEIERPLIYFFDSMMTRSPLGREWRELSFERGWRGYDQDFFVLLEDTLKDQSDEATARLEIYFICLGLGFEGFFEGQPERIAEYKNDIARRLRAERLIDTSLSARLCPEAYESTDTSDDLIKPVGGTIGGIGVLVVGLLIVFVLTVFVGYYVSSSKLKSMLDDIQAIDVEGGNR